jgi:hypothetical protein
MTRVWICKPLIAEEGKWKPQPIQQGTKSIWYPLGQSIQAATQGEQ